MPDSSDIHWTSDAELVSQFVMRHLDETRIADLEAHLRECRQCRDAVSAERELAAGIRRAGRNALKHRLAQRVEEKKSAVGWYRIAAVAAAIVVLVTLGITNNWFFQSETKLADSALRSDSVAPRVESSPMQPRTDKDQTEKLPLADAAKSIAGNRRDQRESHDGGGVKTAELDEKKIEAAEGGAAKPTQAGNVSNIPLDADRLSAAAPAPTAGDIWVEGEVLAAQPAMRLADEANAKTKEEVRGNVLGKRKEPMMMAQTSRSSATEAAAIPVRVRQQSMTSLPRAQRSGVQRASSVQTLLRQNAGGLAVTLFSDSTISTTDLRQARIQSIREDSMILLLGNQRIGYRLPPGWSGQSLQQLKKAK